MTTPDWSERFAEHLKTLEKNRAALAALRRGLGKPPGTVTEMFPVVYAIRVPDFAQNTCFVVAALFAAYPGAPEIEGNLGASFRHLTAKVDGDGPQRRFVALLRTDAEQLPTHLRHAVALMEAKEIGISWKRLLQDVAAWSNPQLRHQVRQFWAKAYWVAPTKDALIPSEPTTLQKDDEHDH